MTLIASALAGGDCIDDADSLRAGSTAAVLGHRVLAPSTLGKLIAAKIRPQANAAYPAQTKRRPAPISSDYSTVGHLYFPRGLG